MPEFLVCWVLVQSISVSKVPGFAITGGVPNAVWMPSTQMVHLIYSNNGLIEVTAPDGVQFAGIGQVDMALNQVLSGQNLHPADVILRETANGTHRYFFKGLAPPGNNTRQLYAADRTSTLQLLNGGQPVYSGPSGQAQVEVPDIIFLDNGSWRMFYVDLNAQPGNARTATSQDEGLSWTFEFNDPFGDVLLPDEPVNMNVDPCPFKTLDGHFLAVTMRLGVLYFWTSEDGLHFDPVPDTTVTVDLFAQEAPGATALFDPTLVQLPDGKILLYTTAGSQATGVIVAAELAVSWPQTSFEKRWIPHLTQAGAGFETDLIFWNRGNGPATVEIGPHKNEFSDRINIAYPLSQPNQVRRVINPFPSDDFCTIGGAEDVLVIAVYRSTSGDGIEAYVPETGVDTQFAFLVQDAAIGFDGVVLVNASYQPNSIHVEGYASNGQSMGQVDFTLPGFQKGKWLVSDWFSALPKLVKITTQYPCAGMALRGSLPNPGVNALWSLPNLTP
ncbi:MAG: hypothetical protein KDC71_16550 [Acidobacteria bacterium]|nr:hypothetical protein [Acidobacteriota bacterium]